MRILYFYRRVFIISVVFLSMAVTALSQIATGDNSMNYNNSASPNGSPNFLNASASISPSLYTGGLQMSLPIYTLKGSDLQLPISIDYTANNGVRPADPNTSVGMDWTLMAGGSITRTVRGLPDESTNGYIGTNMKGTAVTNDFNSPNAQATLGFNNTNNNAGIRTLSHLVDGEPDIFVITTPYFTSQFTLDPSGNPVFRNNRGLKVIHYLYNNSANAISTGITVIDAQGTQYIFGVHVGYRTMATTKFFGFSFQYVSTWYLEKIITLNSKDVISFVYQTWPDETVYSYEPWEDYTATFPSGSGNPPTVDITGYSLNTSNTQSGSIVYNGPAFVSQIITKLGEADFTYTGNSNSNIAASNPPALTSIRIKQFDPATNANTTVLWTYNLTYTDIQTNCYGDTPPYADPLEWSDSYRRLLTTITITGGTTATSTAQTLYNLKYYQNLPFCGKAEAMKLDYWGYQNLNGLALPYDGYFTYPDSYRQPSFYSPTGTNLAVPMAAIFSLQEIDQLGGASTVFNYDQNDYFNGSSNVLVGGDRISSIVRQLPTGENLTTSYYYYDAYGHSTGRIGSDLYRHVKLFYGINCCSLETLCLSQSPYGVADDAGVMVGYSQVIETDPNGGSTTSLYYNFNDYPDNISPLYFYSTQDYSTTYSAQVAEQLSSFSYKRGMLKAQFTRKANGDPVSQDSYTYGSLENNQPAIKEIGIQDNTWWYQNGNYYWGVNIYHSNIEDWRLMQKVHVDFDQMSPTARSMMTTTTYTYAPDNRQVRSITTTDSKGQSHVQTYYYSDDTGIPYETPTEISNLATLASSAINATSLLVHRIDSRNSFTRETHTLYSPLSTGLGTNWYPTTTTIYTAGAQMQQQFLNYDVSTSQLISSNWTGGKSTSATYGYNLSYPLVKIENAVNSISTTTQSAPQTAQFNIPPGEPLNTAFTPPTTFTSNTSGDLTVALTGVPQDNNAYQLEFTITGASTGWTATSRLCNSSSPSACLGSSSIPYHNVPPDTYSMTFTLMQDPSSGPMTVTCTYQGASYVSTGYSEFFYEGFEQNGLSTAGAAHTGTRYFNNSSYTVPFTPPNSRQYIIQWWQLNGSQWVFNQQPYTANMTLTGPIDDVRVFPSDALMTTYTYSPLVGKTSETDPSGKTLTYEYDGLGRLLHVRDQDGNILKQYDYQYQVGLQQ
ncbi:RHS repeat protein [Puia dinghuensis]|uniref:YD repeat-containing protein n=1 Tax=Puia dinghuensis TaxID=1792502 RepID=A0A8J2XTX4_9BACT|nr:RHS repeat domain-containing protein [Puia dinghuensis]GGB06519.1 hypothetical protein GCM10011511_32460 [Puia dinghuensis]